MNINLYFTISTLLGLIIQTLSDCEWDAAISQTYNTNSNTSLIAMYKVGDPLKRIDNITLSKMKKQKILGKLNVMRQSLVIKLKCPDSKISDQLARSYIINGGNLQVSVCKRKLSAYAIIDDLWCQIFEPVLFPTSLKGCETENKGCCLDNKVIPSLCQVVWIVPLDNQIEVDPFKITISQTGVGQFIPDKSFTTSIEAMIPPPTPYDKLSYRQSSQNKQSFISKLSHPKAFIKLHSFILPVIAIGGFTNTSHSDILIFTQNDFKDTREVSVKSLSKVLDKTADVCKCNTVKGNEHFEIYDIGILSDRHLLLTSKGLLEVYGSMSYHGQHKHERKHHGLHYHRPFEHHVPSTIMPRSNFTFPRCANVLILPEHYMEFEQYVLILGHCQYKQIIFFAEYSPGKGYALDFKELRLPFNNFYIAISNVNKITMIISYNKYYSLSEIILKDIIILKNKTLKFQIKELSRIPKIIPKFQFHGKPILISGEESMSFDYRQGVDAIDIQGMISTVSSTNILLFYGSRLLASLDKGHHIYIVDQLHMDAGESILQIAISENGQFSYITSNKKIISCHVDRLHCALLYPSMEWQLVMSRYPEQHRLPNDANLLSLFYDRDYQHLYALYVKRSDINKKIKKIHRLNIPFSEIESLIQFHNKWKTNDVELLIHHKRRTSMNLKTICSLRKIYFSIGNIQKFKKIKMTSYWPPSLRQYNSSGLSNVKSLSLYHMLIANVTGTLQDYTNRKYVDYKFSPLEDWKRIMNIYHDRYIRYLLLNIKEFFHSTIFTDHNLYSLKNPMIANQVNRLNDRIYLGKNSIFKFNMSIVPEDNIDLEDISLNVIISNRSKIEVKFDKEFFYLKYYVTFIVQVCETGVDSNLYYPGQLSPAVSLRFIAKAGDEEVCMDTGNTIETSSYEVLVNTGCQPNTRVVFDSRRSKSHLLKYGEIHHAMDCSVKHAIRPCFYFDNDFKPYFRIYDDTTFDSIEYKGNYTLKIIAGITSSQQLIRYSEKQIVDFNINNEETANIWTIIQESSTNKDGFTIYNENNNAIKWICQVNSPCNDIWPTFPNSPEYMFILEFSNAGVDTSTNCDYAMKFKVKIHGIPLDTRTSVYMLLLSLFAIFVTITVYVYMNIKKINSIGILDFDVSGITYASRRTRSNSSSSSSSSGARDGVKEQAVTSPPPPPGDRDTGSDEFESPGPALPIDPYDNIARIQASLHSSEKMVTRGQAGYHTESSEPGSGSGGRRDGVAAGGPGQTKHLDIGEKSSSTILSSWSGSSSLMSGSSASWSSTVEAPTFNAAQAKADQSGQSAANTPPSHYAKPDNESIRRRQPKGSPFFLSSLE